VKQLEAHEVRLADLFSDGYDFHIPNYQRPYAWEPEQAKQLLADLVDFMIEKDQEPYFLGSIVLIKDTGPYAEVVDGQQRLTTLTILLAVLRDLAEDAGVMREVHRLIAQPEHIIMGLKAKPRLTLRPKDAAFFSTRVQAGRCLTWWLSTRPR
jgi:hypothetical protein